jgi:glycosyltransferase involved in cell wall biosynthesis
MLMVSPIAPWPATTGGLVRIAALVRQMARYFDLTFVCPRRHEQHIPADISARFDCPAIGDPGLARRILALTDPSRPYHAALYRRPEIKRIVEHELTRNHYDVVYSHFIYGMEYVADCRVPVVVDQQNVDRAYWQNRARQSSFPLNLYAAWNMRRTIGYESRALTDIWAYVSVSDEDREQTRRYAARSAEHFWVAPNGVDTRRFTPLARRASAT